MKKNDDDIVLTPKQEAFVLHYVEHNNASAAYRHAYNTTKASAITINKEASKLLKNPNIARRIKYFKEHAAEAVGLSLIKVLKEHKKIAFADATRLRNGWMTLKEFEALTPDERAAIKSIDTKQTKRVTDDGEIVVDEWVKIILWDKQKALDSITDLLGLNAPTKAEVMVENKNDYDLSKLPPELLVTLADELQDKRAERLRREREE